MKITIELDSKSLDPDTIAKARAVLSAFTDVVGPEVEDEPAAPAKATPAPKAPAAKPAAKAPAAKPAPKPAPEPEEDDEDDASEDLIGGADEDEADDELTLEKVVERASTLVSNGKHAVVKEALAQFGVARVSLLKPGQFAEFLAAVA